jgi:hypothetical protein
LNENLLAIDESLRKEADEIIYRKGLHNILSGFGIPYYTGSYSLQLMTWRDLDIYLEVEKLSEKKFFELGSKIASQFQPVKMSFRNERIARTPGLPAGLYWGVYLGNERAGAWKIDVWAMDNVECKQRLEYCDNLFKRISNSDRLKVLEIKSKCWQDPLYRRAYSSSDIYSAVLDNGIENFEQFVKWIEKIL